ncbi:MAG: alternative ribosome rescue aminoacyl-tRNA hydrolase ArfB [Patescibacteria group bacterium]
MIIPRHEIQLVFVRGTGPGGQNVNKTSTTAQLHWNVDTSTAVTDTQKAMIRHNLRNRINNNGELVLIAGEERSQSQNRETAIERLERLVTKAITPAVRRIATKPTRASRERRLVQKEQHSRVKQLRRSITV